MWLDRLAGHASPAIHSPSHSTQQSQRSYSPAGAAGRRPTHLQQQHSQQGSQRPIYGPRSSSLTSASNDSNISLLGNTQQKPNGSNLRQVSRPDDSQNPLKLLDRLLGSTPKPEEDDVKDSQKELALEDIDFEGLSLSGFVKTDKPAQRQKSQSIVEYEQDQSKFNDLHDSIRACDEILGSVELNLTQFQNDLGAVSAEIETLQARSTALGLRLENRRAVEAALGPIVEEITISPYVVKKISEGTIDEQWIVALNEVEKRSKTIEGKNKELGDVKGLVDLKPLLEHLIAMAIERIRNFLVDQIKSLRSPNINAQIIQQQHFIRYKDLYTFLRKHHEVLAEEIGQAYMNTMRWYYLHHFTRYEKALSRVKIHTIDKHDTLGSEAAGGAQRTSMLSGAKSNGPPHDAFNLGRRNDALVHPTQNAVPSHLAEDDKSTHYLEFPFRNYNLALIDNISAEYSFLTTFFSPALSMHAIARYFTYIFQPTFDLGLHLTKTLTSETYDALGLLLCVRLNQKNNFKLQRARVPVADAYINQTNMALWPRFQQCMDAHCESLKALTAKLPGSPPSSKAELAKQSAAPGQLTQRFAAFMSGVLELSKETGDDEPVSSSLARLRGEVEAYLVKSSKGIGEKRKRERYLENSYSLILTIVGEGEGKLAGEQRAFWKGLKDGAEGGN